MLIVWRGPTEGAAVVFLCLGIGDGIDILRPIVRRSGDLDRILCVAVRVRVVLAVGLAGLFGGSATRFLFGPLTARAAISLGNVRLIRIVGLFDRAIWIDAQPERFQEFDGSPALRYQPVGLRYAPSRFLRGVRQLWMSRDDVHPRLRSLSLCMKSQGCPQVRDLSGFGWQARGYGWQGAGARLVEGGLIVQPERQSARRRP